MLESNQFYVIYKENCANLREVFLFHRVHFKGVDFFMSDRKVFRQRDNFDCYKIILLPVSYYYNKIFILSANCCL